MAKNIEMNIKGSDGSYEVLYPAVTNGNINIDSSLMSQYNIDGNSFNDFVSWIGKYNLYWWRRRSVEYQETQKQNEKTDYSITGASVNLTYSKSISVDSGEITFVSPLQISVNASDGQPLVTLAPVYIKGCNGSGSNADDIIYLPSGTTYLDTEDETKAALVKNYSNLALGTPTTGVAPSAYFVTATKNVGEWEYIQSSNRNAYPDSGEQDGYEYKYLSIPFDNAVYVPKIETGSYTGTGTYNGDARATSLTLSFQPKMVFVARQPSGSESSSQIFQYVQFYRLIEENSYVIYSGFEGGISASTSGVLTSLRVKFDGNTIKWYSTSSTNHQMNATGVTYYYFAIGQ